VADRPATGDNGTVSSLSAATVCDSSPLPRSLLGAAAAAGVDTRQLARDAQLPAWAFNTTGVAMIPSRYIMDLFELAEHALGDPDIAMTVVDRHRVGELDLFDYLFMASGTLREGLEAVGRYTHLVTTRVERRVETEIDRETTYSYRQVEPGGRGEELCLQYNVAVLYARARAATGLPVRPVRVAFAQSAPRSHRRMAEALGTRNIDFGAPVAMCTFSARDLDLPMRRADPALARILDRYAASLPTPPPVTWQGYFLRHLARSIEAGSPSLERVARQMAISPRTLQRQLAEHGTTWRAELDAARHSRAVKARQSGTASTAALARQLAYSDPRSVRRARRRWDNEATDVLTSS